MLGDGQKRAPGEVGASVNAVDVAAVQRVREARRIVRDRTSGAIAIAIDAASGEIHRDGDLVGWLPPLYPEWLGGRSFTEAHGLRFPYATGSMANGIATPRLVIAVARAGMLGFYGAAGLAPHEVEA